MNARFLLFRSSEERVKEAEHIEARILAMQPKKFKFLGCKSLVLGCVSWLSSHLHHWLEFIEDEICLTWLFFCEDLDFVTLKISYGTIGSWQLWFCRKLKSATAGKRSIAMPWHLLQLSGFTTSSQVNSDRTALEMLEGERAVARPVRSNYVWIIKSPSRA